MKRLAILALLPLAGCASLPTVDICKSAEFRRSVYQTAISAADNLIASGRPVPNELHLAREAAATALAVLNANCPEQ